MMLKQVDTPRPAPVQAPVDLDAEEERRRIAALPIAERRRLVAAEQEAEAEARRALQDRLEAQRASDAEKRARKMAALATVQADWARTRDELRADAKTASDRVVSKRAELEVAYAAGDMDTAVRLRTEVEIAEEFALRATERVADHQRRQPAYSGLPA